MFFASRFFTSSIFKITAIFSVVVISGLASFTQPAFAIKGDYARYTVCQQLKANQTLRWHGIASGTEDSAYSLFEFSTAFHTKACFRNEHACRKWIKRIWWEIPTMDELRTAYCKPV